MLRKSKKIEKWIMDLPPIRYEGKTITKDMLQAIYERTKHTTKWKEYECQLMEKN